VPFATTIEEGIGTSCVATTIAGSEMATTGSVAGIVDSSGVEIATSTGSATSETAETVSSAKTWMINSGVVGAFAGFADFVVAFLVAGAVFADIVFEVFIENTLLHDLKVHFTSTLLLEPFFRCC
jgi:hypothetical protein